LSVDGYEFGGKQTNFLAEGKEPKALPPAPPESDGE